MAHQLTIQQEPHFLHVVVTGTNNADTRGAATGC
jgi:hypothetical protein